MVWNILNLWKNINTKKNDKKVSIGTVNIWLIFISFIKLEIFSIFSLIIFVDFKKLSISKNYWKSSC